MIYKNLINFTKKSHTNICVLFFLLVISLLLMSRGYPLPYCDDLSAVGASISLAQGHGFTNPYVKEWMDAFPTAKPFFYPPGLSYLQAAWLIVFGVNQYSFLAFQWVILILLSYCTFYFLFHRCKLKMTMCIIASIAMLLAFQLEGFRGEITAYALMMLGVCLSLSERLNFRTLGYFAIAFSGIVYPIAPLLAIPVYLGGYISKQNGNLIHRETWKQLTSDIPSALISAMVAFLIFLWMIGGDFFEFIRVLIIHKNAAIPGNIWDQFNGYWYICTSYNQVYIRLPLLIISCISIAFVLMYSIKKRTNSWVLPCAFFVACLILIMTNPMRAKTFAPCFQIIIIMTAFNQTNKVFRSFSYLLGIGFALLVNLKALMGFLLQKPTEVDNLNQVRNAVSKIDFTKKRVMIDAWSARYVFGYNINNNIIDIATWSIIPKLKGDFHPKSFRPSQMKENEVWIVNEDFYFSLHDEENIYLDKPNKVSIFGKKIPNITSDQFKFFIIDSDILKK